MTKRQAKQEIKEIDLALSYMSKLLVDVSAEDRPKLDRVINLLLDARLEYQEIRDK